MTFGTRLFLAALGVLVLTAGALIFAANRWFRDQLERQFAEELEREALVVAEALPRNAEILNVTAHRFGVLLERRVTFIDRRGIVLGDSEFSDASLELLENHADRPEVIAAFAEGTGTARRLSASTNRPELKVAVRAWPGVVRISAPLEQVNAAVGAVVRTVLLAAAAALALGGLLAAVGARAVSRPVRQLARAARLVGTGATPAYPHSSIPEVRELVRAFRSADEELGARLTALRRERQETHAVIDSMVEGILAADAQGRVLLCNHAARQLLGFAPDETLANLREVFTQREAREVVDRVLDGETVGGARVDVGDRAVLVSGRPIPTGGGVIGLRDITEIERLHAATRDFVANVTHELKTPLTSIVGYTETLIGDGTDRETQQRFLRVVHDNATRMQRLVDDLLDLARLESGVWRPTPEAMDLAAVAAEVWENLAEPVRRRPVGFDADGAEGVEVRADPWALREILTNLLDNARRHTPNGGTIAVRGELRDDSTIIEVRDSGSGIPGEHVPRVFERFYRIDASRSRSEGGTGLGLSIVKQLAEAHGGTVALGSVVGVGTTVTITLPAAQAVTR